MKTCHYFWAIGSALLLSANCVAQITIVAEATDNVNLINVRQESIIPNAFGPALLNVIANPNDDAAANFNIVDGTMHLFSRDTGNTINGFIATSANLNAFNLENITGTILSPTEGWFQVDLVSAHALGGTPADTSGGSGEKTAFARYVVQFQLFKQGVLVGNGVVQPQVTMVWNENGSLKSAAQCVIPTPTETGGWKVAVTSCSPTGITISVKSPALTLGPGESLNLKGGISAFADADDSGLIAEADASNSAQISMTVPEGLEFSDIDDDLGSLGSLSYVTVSSDPAFQITSGLNDAWVSADAPFQGFFFTVFEDLKILFLSWFTYDSVPPNSGEEAVFGAADQRWVSGAGSYAGDFVTVNIELTSGGIFNGSDPTAIQTPGYGTVTIKFINCNEALLTYNFPSIGLSGEMTLTRVVDDNVALCEALSEP